MLILSSSLSLSLSTTLSLSLRSIFTCTCFFAPNVFNIQKSVQNGLDELRARSSFKKPVQMTRETTLYVPPVSTILYKRFWSIVVARVVVVPISASSEYVPNPPRLKRWHSVLLRCFRQEDARNECAKLRDGNIQHYINVWWWCLSSRRVLGRVLGRYMEATMTTRVLSKKSMINTARFHDPPFADAKSLSGGKNSVTIFARLGATKRDTFSPLGCSEVSEVSSAAGRDESRQVTCASPGTGNRTPMAEHQIQICSSHRREQKKDRNHKNWIARTVDTYHEKVESFSAQFSAMFHIRDIWSLAIACD